MTYEKEKPETIQAMFGSIAQRYDRANAVLSLRMHSHWNKKLLRHVLQQKTPHTFLDVCCGTGDIALGYLEGVQEPRQVVMLDFCAEMLECAKRKAEALPLQHHAIRYVQADAQALPLADNSVSCVTIAYGIRNIRDPLKSMQEAYRVLEPGGTFGILELTRPENPMVRLGHRVYLKTILPLVGKWLTSNQEAYRYLCNSIHHFIPPATLEQMLRTAGFATTSRKRLAGGIATLLIAQK